MANIFISYRSNDTPAAVGRIYDAFVGVFGEERVFNDISPIGAGENCKEIIRAKLRNAFVDKGVTDEVVFVSQF